jgi:hypothetical protein
MKKIILLAVMALFSMVSFGQSDTKAEKMEKITAANHVADSISAANPIAAATDSAVEPITEDNVFTSFFSWVLALLTSVVSALLARVPWLSKAQPFLRWVATAVVIGVALIKGFGFPSMQIIIAMTGSGALYELLKSVGFGWIFSLLGGKKTA